MSNPHSPDPPHRTLFSPPPINTVEDTGLSSLVQDLALKILYSQGYMSGFKIAELIALPFAGITDLILEALKREKLIEVKSSQGGLGEGAYTYGITGAGLSGVVKPSSAANMQARRPFRLKSITKPFAARKRDVCGLPRARCGSSCPSWLCLNRRFNGWDRRLTPEHPFLCMDLPETGRPVLRAHLGTWC